MMTDNSKISAEVRNDSGMAVLDTASLEKLGLAPSDVPRIYEVAERMLITDPKSVAEFGREVSEHTSKYTDDMLTQVRNSDLDGVGAKLTEVVNVARSLNMHALSDRRSRIPVIGKLIDKMKLKAGDFQTHFQNTKEQIDRLIDEVATSRAGLAQRNEMLEQMYLAVIEEYHLLGLHVAAGRVKLEQWQNEVAELRTRNLVGTEIQAVADMDTQIAMLDKRIADLAVLQQSAWQTLPTLRIIQANNRSLVEKSHTIIEVTIPAWKRQFMLAASLNEQKNAVELANTIDDATNDLLRKNAELLKQNSIGAAKANQRLVIDVKTLEHVQTMLISTVEEVVKIQREGVQHRRLAEGQLQSMRGDLHRKLLQSNSVEA